MAVSFSWLDGPQDIVHYLAGHTDNFTEGDLVILTDGDHVSIATDDNAVWGVALTDYTAVGSGGDVPVSIINPTQRWVAYADATTVNATHVGGAFDVNVATGAFTVDLGGTTDKTFIITQLDPRDGPHTGSGGRVIGHFNANSCIGTEV